MQDYLSFFSLHYILHTSVELSVTANFTGRLRQLREIHHESDFFSFFFFVHDNLCSPFHSGDEKHNSYWK